MSSVTNQDRNENLTNIGTGSCMKGSMAEDFSSQADIVISQKNYASLIRSYVIQHGLKNINIDHVLARIADGLAPSMTPFAISRYCGEVAASMITQHPEYGKLAAVILVAYHTAVTLPTFSGKIALLQRHNSNIEPSLAGLILEHAAEYDRMIDYSRDYTLSYFALNSLLRSYMLRIGSEPVERPQDIFMRVAIQVCRDDMRAVKETYDLISDGWYTHATPTLFNAVLRKCQLASCFLFTPKGDNIASIFETVGDCAMISKHSGGIGISLQGYRCAGSPLKSTGGVAKGILPIIKILNETMKYVNQGGIRRNSSVALYLEPWHRDILDFLEVRKNTGPEEKRAREVFTAIWMNDLFMERVEMDGEWSLFDPADAPGLHEVWGDKFKELYLGYEKTSSRMVLKAQDLWKAIVVSQIETGTPYVVYKDTSNRLSNQSHLGTIKCSNLCAEIIQYSNEGETAVCNLASICLPRFVSDGMFDFQKLKTVVAAAVRNLNRCIDGSFYPTDETRVSNMRHRPVGIGVQGLADVFIALRHPYESEKARSLNKLIFETMYFAAIDASADLAAEFGPHESFPGSKLSQGIFQWQLCKDVDPSKLCWDWNSLRTKVLRHGTRNSLFIAPMPTAGTSQIFGNTECFEPITSNIFTRRTIAGEFQVVNASLMADLTKLGLWSNDMRHLIIEYDGSIQAIPGIPADIKELYKTVWDIKMKSVVDMAADRQPFIDQSQSMNIYLQQPTYQNVSSMHFYGWKRGLKTGLYYLRSKPISSAIKFTVDQQIVEKTLSSLQDYENSKSEQENKSSACESCSC